MNAANRREADGVVRFGVKAVPGARRDEVVGMLGERLKVRVSLPPEGGKANAAVCRVIAEALGIRPSAVTIIAGHASPEKTVEVAGASPDAVRRLLGRA